MRMWRRAAVAAVLVAGLATGLSAGPETGSICIAPSPPVPHGMPDRMAIVGEVYCDQQKLALRIDSQEAIAWPADKSLRISGLDLESKHRVAVLCGGKAKQTFFFRFSEYKSRELCMFINDLYWTVQLWEKKQAPWCKCK